MNLKRLFWPVIFMFFSFLLKAQPQLELQPFASGFDNPIGISNAGDERLFVVQQRGLIRIIYPDGDIADSPFLDLSDIVSQSSSERGLLGLAFHPNFEVNGFLFVNYTLSNGNTVVSRFSVDEANPELADRESEAVLITIEQPYANHNGGQLLFGPDGYLYIAMGDGGSGGDPDNNAQNPDKLLGKMLRIDVNESQEPYYSIPSDNPFVGDETTRNEIWALGLRNPWRSSFDRLTGDFWIADVGQNMREEVNFQPASSAGGINYGWRCYEGNLGYNLDGCQSSENYEFPVFEYAHQGDGCTGSVTGGYVYRGALYSGMYGRYIFADYCTGNFYQIVKTDSQFEGSETGMFDQYQYTGFGEDIYGELYVILKGAGEVRKVTETSDCNPVAVIIDSFVSGDGSSGQNATLEVPYHPSLEYQWILNDEPLVDETSPILEIVESGYYSVTVTNPENGCQNASEIYEWNPTTILTSNKELDNIFIYPNPAIDQLIIDGILKNEVTSISLFNEEGIVILTEKEIHNNRHIIPTKNLSSGLYVLEITSKTSRLLKKVMIRK